ncbi:MAG: hypothetical protein MJ097_00680 [Dorea sp.]|nr:hypothetical protein [Dorea sp.]
MKSTDKLMDMLCTELDEIAEKGQLSAGDLDTVHKLIVSKEKLLRCEELEEGLGYSQDGGWRAEGSYRTGNSYNNGNSYANRGKHYVRGHYSRSGGRYSYDDGNGMLMESMQEMMQDPALSGSDKEALRRAMDVMRR